MCKYNYNDNCNDYWGKSIGNILLFILLPKVLDEPCSYNIFKNQNGQICDQLPLLLIRLWNHSSNRAVTCTNEPRGNLKSTFKSLSPSQLWDAQTKIISPECCWNFFEIWTRRGSGYFWPDTLRHLTEKMRVDKVSNKTRSGSSYNTCTNLLQFRS